MSQGGSIKAQLEQATKELQEELEEWRKEQINPQGWRMGDEEILIRCEILTLMEVIQERFEISDDELNLRLRRILTREYKKLRPDVIKMRQQAVMQQLTQGIHIKPDLPPNGQL